MWGPLLPGSPRLQPLAAGGVEGEGGGDRLLLRWVCILTARSRSVGQWAGDPPHRIKPQQRSRYRCSSLCQRPPAPGSLRQAGGSLRSAHRTRALCVVFHSQEPLNPVSPGSHEDSDWRLALVLRSDSLGSCGCPLSPVIGSGPGRVWLCALRVPPPEVSPRIPFWSLSTPSAVYTAGAQCVCKLNDLQRLWGRGADGRALGK